MLSFICEELIGLLFLISEELIALFIFICGGRMVLLSSISEMLIVHLN